jgi:hypothetical protein
MGTLLDDLSGIHHQNEVGDSLGRLEDRDANKEFGVRAEVTTQEA